MKYRIQVQMLDQSWRDVADLPAWIRGREISSGFNSETEAWATVKEHETVASWHADGIVRVVQIMS